MLSWDKCLVIWRWKCLILHSCVSLHKQLQVQPRFSGNPTLWADWLCSVDFRAILIFKERVQRSQDFQNNGHLDQNVLPCWISQQTGLADLFFNSTVSCGAKLTPGIVWQPHLEAKGYAYSTLCFGDCPG